MAQRRSGDPTRDILSRLSMGRGSGTPDITWQLLTAIGLFAFVSLTAFLAYSVLKQFLRPLLFAITVGLCLRTMHTALVKTVLSWLDNVRKTRTPLAMAGVLLCVRGFGAVLWFIPTPLPLLVACLHKGSKLTFLSRQPPPAASARRRAKSLSPSGTRRARTRSNPQRALSGSWLGPFTDDGTPSDVTDKPSPFCSTAPVPLEARPRTSSATWTSPAWLRLTSQSSAETGHSSSDGTAAKLTGNGQIHMLAMPRALKRSSTATGSHESPHLAAPDGVGAGDHDDGSKSGGVGFEKFVNIAEQAVTHHGHRLRKHKHKHNHKNKGGGKHGGGSGSGTGTGAGAGKGRRRGRHSRSVQRSTAYNQAAGAATNHRNGNGNDDSDNDSDALLVDDDDDDDDDDVEFDDATAPSNVIDDRLTWEAWWHGITALLKFALALLLHYFGWGDVVCNGLAWFEEVLGQPPLVLVATVTCVALASHWWGVHNDMPRLHDVSKLCVCMMLLGVALLSLGTVAQVVALFPLYGYYCFADFLASKLAPASVDWGMLVFFMVVVFLLEFTGRVTGMVILLVVVFVSLVVQLVWTAVKGRRRKKAAAAARARAQAQAQAQGQEQQPRAHGAPGAGAARSFLNLSTPHVVARSIRTYLDKEHLLVEKLCNNTGVLRGVATVVIIIAMLLTATACTLLLSSRVLRDVAAIGQKSRLPTKAALGSVASWLGVQPQGLSNVTAQVTDTGMKWLQDNGRNYTITFLQEEVFGEAVSKETLSNTLDRITNFTVSASASVTLDDTLVPTAHQRNHTYFEQVLDALLGVNVWGLVTKLPLSTLPSFLSRLRHDLLPTVSNVLGPALNMLLVLFLEAVLRVKYMVDVSLEALVFFTVLSFVLTSGFSHRYVRNSLMVVMPTAASDQLSKDIVAAIDGILRYSLKQPLFHLAVFWLTHALFDVDGGLGRALWSMLAAVVALLGVAPVWLLALPGAMELYGRGGPFNVEYALWFVLLHVLLVGRLAPIIAREIAIPTVRVDADGTRHREHKQVLHPYIIGLSVWGGLSLTGDLVGVLLGPLAVCLLVVVLRVRSLA